MRYSEGGRAASRAAPFSATLACRNMAKVTIGVEVTIDGDHHVEPV
jgi:hypothetical protein